MGFLFLLVESTLSVDSATARMDLVPSFLREACIWVSTRTGCCASTGVSSVDSFFFLHATTCLLNFAR